MRKLFFTLTMLIFSQFCFGQMVQDQAVVPVSVTLNSILRLTVTSGGNIVFVFNTIAQYTTGIAATPRTTTTFQVSSSRTYKVTMATESATFIGLETGSILFTNDNVGYTTTAAGGGAVLDGALHGLGVTQEITPVLGAPAGGSHIYTVAWQVGQGVAPMKATTLAVQSLATDIYVNNIFLTLTPM
ncbi:MAG: hypothetical protein HOO91_17465 [Bacteroidales bacterium]|nr:hypothetical protein [Bacteroidales bacterium]